MIRINLLPHREEKRKARRQQFYALTGMVIVLSGLIWFLGYTLINGQISNQVERNDFLKAEIAGLEKEIAEIKKLKQQTDAFLARKKVIEALQSNRTETIHLFNELSKLTPDGVYLRTLKQQGVKLGITGVAQSNARVTALMDSLDGSPLLERPALIESRAEIIGGRQFNAFNMEIFIVKETQADNKAGKGAKK
jgi:type IV pilus assembly protein PilN